MRERLLAIETPSGRMETFVTHPEQDGPFPPVVIYMDVWGLREELYDIARKVAVAGYYVLSLISTTVKVVSATSGATSAAR